MVPPSLADRLARLTHLCSEINKLAKGEHASIERLEERRRRAKCARVAENGTLYTERPGG